MSLRNEVPSEQCSLIEDSAITLIRLREIRTHFTKNERV